ncbi:MAG: YdbH domain-containing protein [Gilliamella sp.]|uniref:intermembrane phospholipid transport protein YdbH family protein n=1 Tax=Gilliamella sp. TaxID=1891236 RepID=UPI0026128B76|nr:YdbH domain-containing protein [Gilliamella sp.]MCO6552702.1 YdbH domain-containing protein [Gilliamella sp.]
MVRLKKRYWILLCILFFLILFCLFGWHYWQTFKLKNGIIVDWHGASVGFKGLTFDELTVSKPSQVSITAKNLSISLSQLTANNLDIYWQPNESEIALETIENTVDTTTETLNQSDPADPDLSLISTIIYWLPKTIHIDTLRLYEQNKARLDLKVDISKQQEAIQLNLSTNTQEITQLSATLLFNQQALRIDIQNGLFKTSLNQFGLQNSNLVLPFTGWLSSHQLELTTSDKASISLEKANLSDDLILGSSNGDFNIQLKSNIPFDSNQLSAIATLTINKLNGIYKTSEIKSVTGDINIIIKDNQFTISTPALNIQEVNMGIAFEKIKLVGNYLASFKAPNKGTVTWKKAQANIFSGLVFIEENKLNLAKLPQQFNLRLKQIQLKDIFKQYPSEGLAGDGAIDGVLPITLSEINKKGETALKFVIKNGKLVTINEGYLQFENSALKSYGQNNPNMKILTDIIKNFHYTKLQGAVDYANDIAKLKLNIQGSNLDVENGKAVNLNINLEENMTKLLMSLQLSDQISEPIRKRIEAYLKNKSSK